MTTKNTKISPRTCTTCNNHRVHQLSYKDSINGSLTEYATSRCHATKMRKHWINDGVSGSPIENAREYCCGDHWKEIKSGFLRPVKNEVSSQSSPVTPGLESLPGRYEELLEFELKNEPPEFVPDMPNTSKTSSKKVYRIYEDDTHPLNIGCSLQTEWDQRLIAERKAMEVSK